MAWRWRCARTRRTKIWSALTRRLHATRPTAINLKWALDEIMAAVRNRPREERVAAAYKRAAEICDDDAAMSEAIGRHGLELIEAIAAKKKPGEPVNVLTHCNAGWLATVDLGTATAPIYVAHDKGIPIHVWVDETRPRNQGASLTAFELGQHGVKHTVIPDNTGGHLMQHGEVDIAIVGADRVTAQGDACNKIGTYLKALAAKDNGVPFYVALPSSTIDFTVNDGVAEIPIEERAGDEVTKMTGRTADGKIETVTITPEGSPVANYGFDVTPARLVSGLITERGVIAADRNALAAAFPDHPSRKSGDEASRGMSGLLARIGDVPADGRQSETALADRARHHAASSVAWLLLRQRIAAAVRPARRSRGARRRRRNLDCGDQVVGRGFPRRSEVAGLPDALRPAVLCHHARGAVRDFPEGYRADRGRRLRRADHL